MNVLGISGAFHHDAAACLITNGRVVAMAEEERFSRRRHAVGELPVHSSLYCLGEADLSLRDIDILATSWSPALDPSAAYLNNYLAAFLASELFDGTTPPPVEHVEHHMAHAASAYFSAGWPEAAVLVVDGQG